jgi:glycosyltransferase involved in cell wall biosynthesis
MKILMVNYEYPPLGGGAAPVTKSLAEELVHQGHSVDVVTMGFRGLPKEEILNGVHIYRVPSKRKKIEMCTFHEMLSFCISAFFFLPPLLKKNKYDINHTHFIIPTGIVSGFYYRKVPYIITSHGSDVPGYNPDRFQIQHILFSPFSNIILNRARCITSPSGYLKEKILNKFGQRTIEIVPYGISADAFQPGKKKNKIITASRLFERKGIQYVIEAMKDIEGFEYVICGEGPFRPQLERLIEQLNIGKKVKLMGHLNPDELKKEYESAAIFVLPSSSENFPVVLMEAMAAGCAIVTSETTGCAEVVGDAALFVLPTAPQEIRKALIHLIEDKDLRYELGTRARLRVERDYTWKRVAEKYVELYKQAVEASSEK